MKYVFFAGAVRSAKAICKLIEGGDLKEGRLRYVFGLIKRLLNELLTGELVERLSLDIAKPAVIKLAKDR